MANLEAELRKALVEKNLRLFSTSDVALALSISKAHASMLLGRAEKSGWMIRLMRGRWASLEPNAPHPFAVARYIAHPTQIYVTGPYALYHHGLITQIPSSLHAAWARNPLLRETPLGTFSFHRMPAPAADEIEEHVISEGPVRVATPEKALVDTAYLAASPRSGISLFPEVDWDEVDQGQLKKLIKRIKSAKLRKRVEHFLNPQADPIQPAEKAGVDTARARINKFVESAGGWDQIGIFLGSGFSKNVGLPLGAEFVRRVILHNRERLAGADMLHSAEDRKVFDTLITDRGIPRLLDDVYKALGEEHWVETVTEVLRAKPNDFVKNFVSLGGMLFLTTNLDTLVDSALARRDEGGTPVAVWPDKSEVPLQMYLHKPGPQVVHLHGILGAPDSWVLRESEYRKIRENAELKKFVSDTLLARPFLFIGFNLQGQDAHIVKEFELLELALGDWNQNHLAVMPEEDISENDETVSKLRLKYRVEVVPCPRDGISELFTNKKMSSKTGDMPPVRKKNESAWWRALIQCSRLAERSSEWSYYVESRVVPWNNEETRRDPDSIELDLAVKGEADAFPPSELLRLRNILLLGQFGVGKTAYLRRRLAENDFSKRPAIFLRLREVKPTEGFREFVDRHLQSMTRAQEHLFATFMNMNPLCLIDGVDELSSDNRSFIQELADFAATNPGCRFLVTSRPGANLSGLSSFDKFQILPFSHTQAMRYMTTRLGSDHGVQENIVTEVLQLPVFAEAYCELRKKDRLGAEDSTGKILERLLRHRLSGEKDRGTHIREIQIMEPHLKEEAFAMQSKDCFQKDETEWFTGAAISDKGQFREEVIRALIRGTILIRYENILEFQHRVWQEYLAGMYIAQGLRDHSIDNMDKHFWSKSGSEEGVPARWYAPLKYAAEVNHDVANYLWATRRRSDAAGLAAARLLPTTEGAPGRDQSRLLENFKTLVTEYERSKSVLRSNEHSVAPGVDDAAILTQLATKLGPEGDSVLGPLLDSTDWEDRRFAAHIAWCAKREELLASRIEKMLLDSHVEVRAHAARAARDLRLGRIDTLEQALEKVEKSYYVTAEILWNEILQRDPQRAARFLTDQVSQLLAENGGRDEILGWLLKTGAADALDRESLGRIAANFKFEPWGKALPPALARKALSIGGLEGFRIMVLAHICGTEREISFRKKSSEGEEDLDAMIKDRLLSEKALTLKALLPTFAVAEHLFDIPSRAYVLFSDLVEDPEPYLSELHETSSQDRAWIDSSLARAYWAKGKRKNRDTARRLLQRHGWPESDLFYSTGTPTRPQRPRRKEVRLADLIERSPKHWLGLINESLARQAVLVSEKLQDLIRNEVQKTLNAVAPGDAVSKDSDGGFRVITLWRNALNLVQVMGPEEFEEKSIAALADVIPDGWIFADPILRADTRAGITTRLRKIVAAGPHPDLLYRALGMLKERGANSADLVAAISEHIAKYRDLASPAYSILDLCKVAGPTAHAKPVVEILCGSSSESIAFRASSLACTFALGNASEKACERYLGNVIRLAKNPGLDLFDSVSYLINIPCHGHEEELGALVRDLFPVARGAPEFDRRRILNWALEHLRRGETAKSVTVLSELADSAPEFSHLRSFAEEARLNLLNRIQVHAS